MKLKIKDNIGLEVLLKYGFSDVESYLDKSDEDYDLFINYNYINWIGHSRRGQHYCLLVGKSREINIYATQPDGYGGVCALPKVLLDMAIEGLFE